MTYGKHVGPVPADLLREGHLLQPASMGKRMAVGRVAARRAMEAHPIIVSDQGGQMVALAAMLRGNRRRRK